MGFWNRLFGHRPTSREVAKDRLHLVLVHDRIGLSEEVLTKIQDEIINALSRYVDIDREQMDISLSQGRGESKLVANIPIRPLRAPR